jgi:hypothetical protein
MKSTVYEAGLEQAKGPSPGDFESETHERREAR